MKKTQLPLLLLPFLTGGLSAQLIVNDVDNDDGWTNINGGWYSTALTPQAGDNFWVATVTGSGDMRGLEQEFDETYTFDTTYTATFSVGLLSDKTLGNSYGYFFADTGNDGFDMDDRIFDTRLDGINPTPAAGEWEEWSVSTTITAASTTNRGSLVTEGDNIGFVFFFRGLPGGVSSSAAFDKFSVSTIPEPKTYGMIGGLLALSAVFLRRRK